MMALVPAHDHLKWEGSRHFTTTLAEIGSSCEEIKFSGWVEKINSKGYVQPRVLVITDLALYNFRGGFFTQCKRRIDMRVIDSIVRSKYSQQFILCCPEEYDYHYSSSRVSEICDTLVAVYRVVTGKTLAVDLKVTDHLFLLSCQNVGISRQIRTYFLTLRQGKTQRQD
ncbi:uncharacterized protein LOC112341010 [Selaginella moellendorffii]|nr:uncharacterized protein LOC112341010 [Selaginella moellendorffii]|eukprot:XP_024516129.1 uncharacterized protein LOC112341010 [Selaginella moellendorffii]